MFPCSLCKFIINFLIFSVSSMITVPVNTSLYQTVVQQISDGSIQVNASKVINENKYC